MSNREQEIELIDGYLQGSISEEERASVEDRLASDEEFRQLYRELRAIRGGVIAKSREDIYHKIKEIGKEFENKQSDVSGDDGPWEDNQRELKPVSWYRIAAAVVLIAVGGYVLYSIFGGKEDLYSKYYQHYSELSIPQSRGYDPADDAVQMALESYQENDYQEVLNLLSDVDPANEEAALLRGLAHLGLEQYKEAIPDLVMAANSDGPFSESGKYFLSLALIAEGENEEALKWLNSIDPGSYFPVEELIKEVEYLQQTK